MFLLIGAFFAGMITILAPCVLPLLPVIIGGSISGNVNDKRRPFIITASLAVSLILFTILLKATTLFIDVPPEVFVYISGGILIALGIVFLFPGIYEWIILKLNLQAKSQQLLGKSSGKGPIVGAIITGAALGPVFSSCSPVYAYILATILPVNFGVAMLYMISYVLGLSVMLLLVGFLGRKFVSKIKFASNPKGWFNRTIAIIFIVVGVLVITGFDKRLQTYISEKTPFDFDSLSSKLIPASSREASSGVLNVKPYAAPEFTGLTNWINNESLTLEDLRGKVVLVDFWTYSCINCIRTQPYLKSWHETYKDSGLIIIGVHAPEFAFEQKPENVKNAAQKAGLEYPIALDNDFSTWNAYENQYWPASYLIDKDGQVRRYHGGEGEYKETEQAIRTLLAENGGSVPEQSSSALSGEVPVSEEQTPETYLGTKRASNYTGMPNLIQGTHKFEPAKLGRVNQWTLGGTWEVTSEGIIAKEGSMLSFRFGAKEMYTVTANEVTDKAISVTLNGKPISQTNAAGEDVKNSKITVNAAQLYKIVNYEKFKPDSVVKLTVPEGVQLNVFTFGS
jgi:cytochrome c biogenesis protein CcdA/thiol-disulfide isomerase/thioredoxin